jgi:NhaP-type Na+/H+ or K+/H+ antiporter
MKLSYKDPVVITVIVALLTRVGNFVGYKIDPITAFPGMFILFLIVIVGLWITKIMPGNLPAVVYVSLLGIILTMPWFPLGEKVAELTSQVNFLALTTPILGYAGLSMGKDLDSFKKHGLKIVIVAIFVFIGTYIGSAIIAQVVLKLTGQI